MSSDLKSTTLFSLGNASFTYIIMAMCWFGDCFYAVLNIFRVENPALHLANIPKTLGQST